MNVVGVEPARRGRERLSSRLRRVPPALRADAGERTRVFDYRPVTRRTRDGRSDCRERSSDSAPNTYHTRFGAVRFRRWVSAGQGRRVARMKVITGRIAVNDRFRSVNYALYRRTPPRDSMSRCTPLTLARQEAERHRNNDPEGTDDGEDRSAHTTDGPMDGASRVPQRCDDVFGDHEAAPPQTIVTGGPTRARVGERTRADMSASN